MFINKNKWEENGGSANNQNFYLRVQKYKQKIVLNKTAGSFFNIFFLCAFHCYRAISVVACCWFLSIVEQGCGQT